jgi:hypothetical protein
LEAEKLKAEQQNELRETELRAKEKRVVELQRQLEGEKRQREEAERQVEKLKVESQKQLELEWQKRQVSEKRANELQRQLEGEKRQREEAERQVEKLKLLVQKLEAGQQPQTEDEIPLVSAKGVDYRKLRDLLKAKKWHSADKETNRVILKVASRESEGWLRDEDAKNFSCQDLGTIDKLWVKHSNGKFGFSVQKQIYQSLGGTKEYNSEIYRKYGDKVGWRKGGKWLYYNQLTFSAQHYIGHLPGAGKLMVREVWAHLSLVWRYADCNI